MYWSRYVRYPRLLKGVRSHLYHILDHGNGWLIRYLDPSRTVITCHDLIPLLFGRQRRSLFGPLTKAAFQHAVTGLTKAKALLVNSSQTRKDLVCRLQLDPRRIHITPLGVEPEFRPLPSGENPTGLRKKFDLPEGVLLLHVGHTAFYKNVEGLLHCLKILRAREQPVWLIRVGEGLQLHQRTLAKRFGIADRVVELGSVSRGQLQELYRAADLLVFPSWYEGQGLPPLEAMASGLPVVASNRGALPQTLGQAGILVEPNAPAQMADAVGRILGDRALRTQLCARGLKRAADFRWETTAQETLRVYRSLLENL